MLVKALVLDLVDELCQLLNVALAHRQLQVPSVHLDLRVIRRNLEGRSHTHSLSLILLHMRLRHLLNDLAAGARDNDRESLEGLIIVITVGIVGVTLLDRKLLITV